MTQIISGLPLATPSHAAPTVKPSAGPDQAWLQQLERARWEARPRYRAGEGGTGSQPEQRPQDPIETVAAAVRARESTAGRLRTAQASAAAPARSSAGELPVSTQALVAHATQGRPPAAAWVPTLAASERLQQELLRVLKAATRARTGEPWSERNVHVQPEGEGFAVWIRDAALTPESMHQIMDAIERLVSETGGRRAIRFTVNGQPVAAVPITASQAGERLGN